MEIEANIERLDLPPVFVRIFSFQKKQKADQQQHFKLSTSTVGRRKKMDSESESEIDNVVIKDIEPTEVKLVNPTTPSGRKDLWSEEVCISNSNFVAKCFISRDCCRKLNNCKILSQHMVRSG
jgi:hypothetical protein